MKKVKVFLDEKSKSLTIKELGKSSFIEKQVMWEFKPADSAIITKDSFLGKGVKNIDSGM